MRKHHSAPAALAVRALTAWTYGVGPSPRPSCRAARRGLYRAHARQALLPGAAALDAMPSEPASLRRRRASSSIRLDLVGLRDAAVDRGSASAPPRRGARGSSSPGWRRRASQRRSSAVKNPIASRTSG